MTDLLIAGRAVLKHQNGAAGIEGGADRRRDCGQGRQLDPHHVGSDDVHQLENLDQLCQVQDLDESSGTTAVMLMMFWRSPFGRILPSRWAAVAWNRHDAITASIDARLNRLLRRH